MPEMCQSPAFVAGNQVVRYSRVRHGEQMRVVGIAGDGGGWKLFEQRGERMHCIEQPFRPRRVDSAARRGVSRYAREL